MSYLMPDHQSSDYALYGMYLKDIGELSYLGRKEEIALIQRIRKGDVEARHSFVRTFLPFVIHLVNKFRRRQTHLSLLNLIQNGNLGLLIALDRFKLEYHTRFTTYATKWVRIMLCKCRSDEYLMRVPHYTTKQSAEFHKVEMSLKEKFGSPPSLQEIAKAMRIDLSRLEEVMRSGVAFGFKGDYSDLASEFIADELNKNCQRSDEKMIESKLNQIFLQKVVSDSFAHLKLREQFILKQRFGLFGAQPHTLQAVGQMLKITREAVRQTEAKALAKLRRHSPLKTEFKAI